MIGCRPRRSLAVHALLLTLLGAVPAHVGAETSTGSQTPSPRPRIGLVLGGGGARGAAHIGVIRVLEELRVPVDFVVGTSMGAIIGGLYCAGYDADAMEETLASIDWSETLRDTPHRSEQPVRRKEEDLDMAVRYRLGLHRSGPVTPPGAIQGQHLLFLLRRVLAPVQHLRDFDDLKIPFRAVATDLRTGELVVLDHGDLPLAIRSSMSVPGAFAPVVQGDQIYVDGYVVSNVPVDVARAWGADVIIAVDVSTDLVDVEGLVSALSVSMRASQILTVNRTAEVLEQLRDEDVYVDVAIDGVAVGDFDRSLQAVPFGETAARGLADALRAWSVDEAQYARWSAAHHVPALVAPRVAEVRVDESRAPGITPLVRARLRQREGVALDLDRLERDLDRLYAIGRFSLIDYTLEPADDGVTLVVRPEEKAWGPTLLRFGLRLTDDFRGRSEYRLTMETLTHGLDRRGREWRNRIDVGEPLGLRTELYQPLDLRDRWFVGAMASWQQREFLLSIEQEVYVEYGMQSVGVGLDLGRNFGQSSEWRVGARTGHGWVRRRVGLPGLAEEAEFGRGQLRTSFVRDTLDDFVLPSSGLRLLADAVWSRRALGSDEDGTVLAGALHQALHRDRHCLFVSLMGGGLVDGDLASTDTFFLGGRFRLSGYAPETLYGDRFGLGRVVYYNNRGLGDLALVGTPVYYGFSVEAGNAWFPGEAARLDDVLWSGSTFAGIDTPLGPLFAGVGFAEQGRESYYFSLGPLFGLGRDQLFADF